MVPQIEFPSASRFLTGTTNSCTEAAFTSSCPRGKHVCPPTQAADHTHTSAGSVALSASFLQAIVASIKTETVQQQTPAEVVRSSPTNSNLSPLYTVKTHSQHLCSETAPQHAESLILASTL